MSDGIDQWGRGRPSSVACAFVLALCASGLYSLVAHAPDARGSQENGDAAAIRLLIDRAVWIEAESAARALIAKRSAIQAESVATAEAIDLLVEILIRTGRWGEPESRELAHRAVAVKETLLGPESPDVAVSLIHLGRIEKLAGPVAKARETLQRALRISEQAFGPTNLPVSEALNQLAWSTNETGDIDAAIAFAERALVIREGLLDPDDLLVAESLETLGGIVRNAGDFQRAMALHERALGIRRRLLPPGHPDLAQSVLSVAEAKHRDGDLAGALPLYEEALRMRERADSTNLLRLSEVLLDMADLLKDLGDFEAARPLYERGHRIRVEKLGEGNHLTGLSHFSYAGFFEAAGDDAGARAHFESAISSWDRALPPGHPLPSVGRLGLGTLLRRQGDLESARRMLQDVVDFWSRAAIPNHPYGGAACMELGCVLRDLGDTAGARSMLDRSLEILSVGLGREHPRYAEALLERARLAWMEGAETEALDGAVRAEETLRVSLREATRGLSEGEALRYQRTMISGLDLAFSILQASPSRPAPEARTSVFDALIRSRTLVLDEIAARHRGIRKSENPEVARLDRTLEQARHTYARLLVEGPSPRSPGPYPARLKGARLEMEQAERALAETSRDFIDERRRLDLTREAIVRALPAGTALVSYFVYRRFMEPAPSLPVPSYLAIVLTPHAAAPIIVPLGRADEIEARIDRWWEEASTAPADPAADATYETASQALRQSIWDPVARHLGRATGAFVVPDGAVHAVSLATLVDARGTYLLESGPTFHYLSAERDLLTPAAPAPRGRGLLALGGPDFDAPPKVKPPPAPDAGRSETPPRTPKTDPCSDSAAVRFSPIPGSTMEAEQVRTLWSEHGKGRTTPGPIVLLRGAEATEGNLCRSAPGKHVLHLATHAFYLPSRCEGGRPADLARSTPGRDPREGRLEAGVPLRVSGLALSGANQRGGSSPPPASEDGLLTGEEIVSLDLSDVAWVVLSGCRTGIGLARAGEGIFGLRRSFQIAGARTLILSLWPVGDNEPQAWMMELYRGRAAGGTTADVTRRASQHILAQRRKAKVTTHPFFWGAFVATGDWR